MVAVIEQQTDAQLVIAVAAREEGAVDALVERYWRRAYLVALQLVERDPGAAEDVAQETFVQVMRSAKRFKPGAAFRPWFFQILRHVASKHARSEGRRRRREEAVSAPEASGSHTEAVDAADTVRSYLGRLSPPVREVLTLHFVEGLSHREVATVIGAPLGTVSSRIRTGVERLRGELQGVSALAVTPLPLLVSSAFETLAAPSAPTGLELLALSAEGAAMAEIPEPPSGETLADEIAQAQKSSLVKMGVVIALISAIAGYAASRPFKTKAEAPATEWRVAAAKAVLPIPSGWVITDGGSGQEVLARQATIGTGFADNVTLTIVPAGGKGLDALEAENKAGMPQVASTVHRVERQTYSWGEGVAFDYERDHNGALLRHAGVLFLRGDEQVVLTVTCLAERWSEVLADVEAIVAGVALDAPPKAEPR